VPRTPPNRPVERLKTAASTADIWRVDTELTAERLLAIIQTQNDIVATALDFEAVMASVVERAQSRSGAEAAVLELADGDEMVYHVAKGAAGPYVGLRLSARCRWCACRSSTPRRPSAC
jgi:sulfur carrier protein ThiS